jgi:RHS repeat-associated protein
MPDGSNDRIVATFEPYWESPAVQTQTLTLDLAGSGTGTVSSNPAGISCTGAAQTCTAAFADSTVVTLTATPDSGQAFTGWSGACSGTGTCTVTLSAARYVAAHFRLIPPIVTTYYHLDTLGSVRAVTDAAGATLRREDYFVFGEGGTPPAGDPLRFTGKMRDSETALDYFGARYYRNVAGRFTTVDPLLGEDTALTDPQRWNRYSYVGNRPLRVIDPDGRGWASKLIKLVVKGGDIAATFADVVEDVKTLIDGNASLGDKALAVASIASEVLPVSIGDAKSAVSFAVRHGDEAVGAVEGGSKGLTTPGKFFGDKTAKEASDALGSKFGPPKSSRPGADTFYNPKTGRSYNVHTDPAHGPPHVDVRTRGPVPDRKIPLGGGN